MLVYHVRFQSCGHTHAHTYAAFNNTRSHENSDGVDVGNTEKEVPGAGRGGVNVPRASSKIHCYNS